MSHVGLFKCVGKRLDIIEEHFHPSGSVRYTTIDKAQIVGTHRTFNLTYKEELRKV
jgi:hypothetical protein